MSAHSFSSFPPSFCSFPELKPEPQSKTSERKSGSRNSGEKRNKDGERERKRYKDRRKPRSSSRLRHVENQSSGVVAAPERHEFQHIFYSDRKGDPLNVQYGGLHAGDVPKYRLAGGGRNVLGLSNSLIAVRRAGKGVEIGVAGRRKLSSLTDSSCRTLLAAPPTRHIVVHFSEGDKYREVDGFIRIPSRRGRTNIDESYRSIVTVIENSDSESPPESDHNTDNDDGNSSEGDTAFSLTSHQETLKTLERALADNPGSVDNWVSLLSHTLSSIPITSKNATKAQSEITISLLSRAFSADPQNSRSKLLRLKYLKAGEELWHESKLKTEWEDTLRLGGVEIWMEWLEWVTRKGNRGVDGVVDAAVRALESFGSDEEGQLAKIRVFWRTAVAIQNAGYAERATAMFQAQAELTFNLPKSLSAVSFPAQLDELEQFWESETPRVGEENAKGWNSWYASGKADTSPVSTTLKSCASTELDPYRQWAAQELEADRTFLYPVRSSSGNAESDPYSTIFFADIRPMMLDLRSSKSKDALRTAWISSLGLHIPGLSLSLFGSADFNWDDRWNMAHLTKSPHLRSLFPSPGIQHRSSPQSVAGVTVGPEREYKGAFGPVRHWGMGVFSPLDIISVGRKASTTLAAVWGVDDVSSVDTGLVRQVFKQLRDGDCDHGWDSLALSFEVATNMKSALKLSKAFLSTARESLVRWGTHAQLERIRGRVDEARKVFKTVLIASTCDPTTAGASQIWWNWAEMEWLEGDSDLAINVVLLFAGIEGNKSGTALLRCRRMLEDGIQRASHWKDREAWIKLRALLELLIGTGMMEVLDIFDSHMSTNPGKIDHESLTVASLFLLYRHGILLRNAIPPAMLRQRAEKALQDYPSNSIILGIFLEGERGQGIWGRVRGLLGGSDGKVKDVARRIEEVWVAGWEKGRWASEVERTRSGLSAAIEHERTRASPVIWRIYIELEIQAGALQNAKKLLFRALGECPLVKDLYLLAFGSLRGVFDGRELSTLADVMAERGLRLRKGLDEVVKTGEVGDDLRDQGDVSEDEIEYNARELRRLMPY